MDLKLSWDLLILILFAVIIAYSFIIGRNGTLKIIISTYIAILAADAFANLSEKYIFGQRPLLNLFTLTENTGDILITLKILVFIFTIVILTVRGCFIIDLIEENSSIMRIAYTSLFGFLSAGLIVSTLLMYISGHSLVSGTLNIMNESVATMYQKSIFMQQMIDNYNYWFALPAICFVLISFTKRTGDVMLSPNE